MDAGDTETVREKALRRLLAAGLRRGLQPASPDCPEPGILAAYFDHSLGGDEASRWETHFAACARCQQALAALAVSEPAAATDAPAGMPHVLRMPRRVLDWRWLAPVGAAAAAVVLWVAIRPAPDGERRSVVTTQAPAEAQNEIARNTAPPPPGSASGPGLEAVPAKSGRAESPRRAAGRERQQVATLSAELSAPAAVPKRAVSEKDKSRQNLSSDYRSDESVTGAKPDAERYAIAIAKSPEQNEEGKISKARAEVAAAAPPSAAALPEAARKSAQEPAMAQSKMGTRQPGVLSDRVAQKESFMGVAGASAAFPRKEFAMASPNGAVLWRLGPRGSIERSQDAGRTWQLQTSGVVADLLAGSAPSETVCWVVGRAGTILRTTDGERWEKIFSPAPLDWTGVEARDALNATVFAPNQQRYVTSDGGRTWRTP